MKIWFKSVLPLLKHRFFFYGIVIFIGAHCMCLSLCVGHTDEPYNKTPEPMEMLWAKKTRVRCKGTYRATWRIRLNDPFSAAMRAVATVTVAACIIVIFFWTFFLSHCPSLCVHRRISLNSTK